MREIEFRGKRAADNEWIYGDLIHQELDDTILIHHGPFFSSKVIKDTIGQYIDLVDADGKKIYEGDVVQHLYEYSDETDRYLVQWDDEDLRFCFENTSKKGTFMALEDFYDDYNGDYAIRIIGNIHDSPELWEEE